MGNIPNIAIPIFEDDLYNDQVHTEWLVAASLQLAKSLGITSISLTGLIPSATNYRKELIPKAQHMNITRSTGYHQQRLRLSK